MLGLFARLIAFLAGVAAIIFVQYWTEADPFDPPRLASASAAPDPAELVAILDHPVTFHAQAEPLGDLVDRLGREHQLPLRRQEGGEIDWTRAIDLEIKHPIRLRSALGLLGQPWNWESGELWIGPSWRERPLLVLPAAEPGSVRSLRRMPSPATGGEVWLESFAGRFFVAAGRKQRLADLEQIVQSVQAIAQREIDQPVAIDGQAAQAPDSEPADAAEQRITALLQQSVAGDYVTLQRQLQAIQRTVPVNVQLREIDPSETYRRLVIAGVATAPADKVLDAHLAARGLIWRIEHEAVVIEPAKPNESPAPVWKVYPVGVGVPDAPAPPDLAEAARDVVGPNLPWAGWFPSSPYSPSGALVVRAEARQHERLAEFLEELATQQLPPALARDLKIHKPRRRETNSEYEQSRKPALLILHTPGCAGLTLTPMWRGSLEPSSHAITPGHLWCDFSPGPDDFLASHLPRGKAWEATEILAAFLTTSLNEQSTAIDAEIRLEAVPGGVMGKLPPAAHQRLSAAWSSDGPLQQTWLRWLRARPDRRGAALAPAIAGDDPLAAALGLYLLERESFEQARGEILICLSKGTIQRTRGPAFTRLLCEVLSYLRYERPQVEFARALHDLAANTRATDRRNLHQTLNWTIRHGQTEVRAMTLTLLAREEPCVKPRDLVWWTDEPQYAAPLRRALTANVEHWLATIPEKNWQDLFRNLVDCRPGMPAILDILKQWVFDDERRAFMQGAGFETARELYVELLRDRDPEVRLAALKWLSVIEPSPEAIQGVGRLWTDPFCSWEALRTQWIWGRDKTLHKWRVALILKERAEAAKAAAEGAVEGE